MKLSVVYHSVAGHTKEMADVVVQGMEKVPGVEAKAMSIDEIDVEWMKESPCIVFGTPVYAANVTPQMASFLMYKLGKNGQVPMAGKLVGAFSTTRYVHGGGELAIQYILNHMLVMGCMVYSSGMSGGLPTIHLGPQAVNDDMDKYKPTFEAYGERMAAQAMKVFG